MKREAELLGFLVQLGEIFLHHSTDGEENMDKSGREYTDTAAVYYNKEWQGLIHLISVV